MWIPISFLVLALVCLYIFGSSLSLKVNVPTWVAICAYFGWIIFTILAILIACLGLFGLASYMVEQRTKEIGIRKVFGANEITILKLISRDFLLLVTAGIVIAIPAAYFFMSNWLENYVYRTNISIVLLLSASVLTITITFLTVSYKSYQAAVMNPASSLKTE
jgi:ABC-type antimicrobial peptide transport system permease subunit